MYEASNSSYQRMLSEDSIRRGDVAQEQIINDYLFGNKYLQTCFGDIVQVDDEVKQKEGIDWQYHDLSGRIRNVDTKAATDYINHDFKLKTFCLELSTDIIRNGMPVKRYYGWYLNPNSLTDEYFFIWIDKAKVNKLTCKEDILEGECMLVKKDSIKKWLDNRGLTEDRLREIESEILINHDNIREGGIKFMYVSGKREKPIVMLVRREDYLHMEGTRHFMINQGKFFEVYE